MKKILKSKYTRIIFIISFIGIVALIILNYGQLELYQLNNRNLNRVEDLENISYGLTKYIDEVNNCPTISSPVSQTFLPELVFDDRDPKGGVNISLLENTQNYFENNKRDPSGNPYFIGISGNLIYIYTNDYELNTSQRSVYYKTVEANLCNQVPVR
jgi:hypothetical protein